VPSAHPCPTVRLGTGVPSALVGVLDFLGAHAVPGVERYTGGELTRSVRGPHGPALVGLSVRGEQAEARIEADPRDLDHLTAATRRLLDLDSDRSAADAVLGADPVLAALVRARPGLRAPGAVDGVETLVRTIVGQQVSVSGARTVTGRIVERYGEPGLDGWRLFPSATALAAADPLDLPMPRARGRSVVAAARAVADGGLDLSPDADRDGLRAGLLALPGVGPWTADYVLMRVTGDPDVLLASDLVVKRAAADLGVDLADGRPTWAPFRSYATHHLWAHLYADAWRAAS
jgi:AraC family transcriptional regulator, regulatory protein of adaptative response / DNA-3-methyladenine glycosylase II